MTQARGRVRGLPSRSLCQDHGALRAVSGCDLETARRSSAPGGRHPADPVAALRPVARGAGPFLPRGAVSWPSPLHHP